ncbi:MAG: hypothetical protein JO294_08685 [Alphaproteobacteria bacterium]|nr:hypothetical protein [Alphaproteobacteria bacterium]
MIAEEQRFYVFGRAEYTDVFGEDCWVQFCAYMEGQDFAEAFEVAAKTPRQPIQVAFKIAGFNNDASFNPKRQNG